MMPQAKTMLENAATQNASNGGRMVAVDGRALPLVGARLSVDARGGIARTVLEQRFANPHDEPLTVTYLLPLPADGAVSAFAFRVGGRRVVGEIDRRAAARERFEQAILDGRSAAIVEQERSSLFTQELGNVPPRAEVIAEITVDQRLAWLGGEGAWEWRFPTTVAPRFLGAPGVTPDAARVMVDVANQPIGPRMRLTMSIRDRLAEGRHVESPSHAVTERNTPTTREIELASDGGVPLDRDLVVRWPVTAPTVGVTIDTARPAPERPNAGQAYGLVTLVPPALKTASVKRDLIVLLDTSGSMSGAPLEQARRIVGAIVDTLSDKDSLEMIEFSTDARRWKAGPASADAGTRKQAHAWLKKLQASGSTEMRVAIVEALSSLRAESQRQVVLITDGLIGFESEVVRAILDGLPRGSRVHTVGVGSGVNRSLTGPAARAGHGVEVVVGLGEDPERAARQLVARTAAPLVVELELSGAALVGHAPACLPDLFAGAPALVGVELRPEGGELVVRGRSAEGEFAERMFIPPTVSSLASGIGNGGIVSLYGRERVEDCEMRVGAGESQDGEIERLGLTFQIATRLTSWIAVSEEATVDPNAPSRKERMPHELPFGMSAEGLGLRAPAPMMQAPGSSLTRAGGLGGIVPHPSPSAMPAGGAASYGAPPSPVMSAARPSTGQFAASKSMAADFEGADDSVLSPPAPADAPAKKSGGIVSAIGGAIGRMFGAGSRGKSHEADAPESRSEPPTPPAPPSQPAREQLREGQKMKDEGYLRTFAGRVVRRRGGSVLVEITIDQALAWTLPARVTVELADGQRIEVEIDAKASTRSGELTAGVVVRLALSLPAAHATDELTWLQIDGGIVVLFA